MSQKPLKIETGPIFKILFYIRNSYTINMPCIYNALKLTIYEYLHKFYKLVYSKFRLGRSHFKFIFLFLLAPIFFHFFTTSLGLRIGSLALCNRSVDIDCGSQSTDLFPAISVKYKSGQSTYI